MAITMMVSKERWLESPETVTVVRDYFGHEEGRVVHSYDCPLQAGPADLSGHLSEECLQRHCSVCGPLYMETSRVGLVVETGERNFHDDSDFLAVYWDREARMLKSVTYGTTRGWSYPNHAEVDATPEVLAEVEAYRAECRIKAEAYRAAAEAKMVREGRRVTCLGKSTKGVYAKGDQGTVTALRTDPYAGPFYRNGYKRPEQYQQALVRFDNPRTVQHSAWISVRRLSVVQGSEVAQ